jgi:hypothetical protein
MSNTIKLIIFLVMLSSFCVFDVSRSKSVAKDFGVDLEATGKRAHLVCRG